MVPCDSRCESRSSYGFFVYLSMQGKTPGAGAVSYSGWSGRVYSL